MPRLNARWAVFGTTVLLGLALTGTASFGAVPTAPKDACDPVAPAGCMLPFPDNYYTVPDRQSATGLRVHFDAAAMPANVLGQHIDPTEWNRQDGFSPGEPILVQVPGLDVARSHIAPVTDVGSSLDADAPIVLINTRTGKRTPYWAELDAHAAAQPDRQLLIIRPAVAMDEGATYVVGLRDLRDSAGRTLRAPASFSSALDAQGRKRTTRDAQVQHLAGVLAAHGVHTRDLYLAWDFTIASEQNLTGRVLAMRDTAFGSLGRAAPKFTVTSVTDYPADQDPRIARQVVGTVTVPSFLTGSGGPGSRLHYGPASGNGLPATPDALPTPSGTNLQADFVCNIPRSADAAHPAHLSLYGHGLLGSPTEVNAGNVKDMSEGHDFMFCATSWIGLAADDVNFVSGVWTDVSQFPAVPDRLQQSFLNFLFLGRDMDTASGFASNPAFQDAKGHSLLDVRGGLHYDGNSQGGINGGALTAIAQDYTRAVLGVPGMNYSTLLQRSVDFAPFQQILDVSYPDPINQQLLFGLVQMLWDRGEADGYAQHITSDPLPHTPNHTVLMHVAFADHQVSNAAAEVEARTIGARLYQPALAPGWTDEKQPYWGIPPLPNHPYQGSAMVVWNSGAAFNPPPTNLAPDQPQYGADPHEFPRAQPQAQQQKATFLLTGLVVNVCGGKPCPSS
ncbi:hypothetical protein GCM10023322_56380 [Rugosimonospora acidiphila]|uniref:ATP-dependent DNA helicase RecG n=1 Tax=Rugosimonospora acidiphila TaxID=556531 RepID=A0ABP9SDK9_9ACTN